MTGYTVHTGSSDKFSSGWDNVFGSRKEVKKSAPRKSSAKKSSTGKVKKNSGKKKAVKGK